MAQNGGKHIGGDIIVQLEDEHNIYNLIDDLTNKVQLEVKEVLSPALRIWLLHFDHNIADEIMVLETISRHPSVKLAQFNHILELRGEGLKPNDPLFNLQWQYLNDGSNGGTTGADIDITKAWEITTGGKNKRGEEIVIAVIDVGIDLLHPDFSGNLWVNKNEIAGNGIDDDGNGYIDDIYGWNMHFNHNNVQGGSHGTSVSGIIGAKGNNDTGVAGVNWNIKLMTIIGGGAEADAIKAYNYVYVMRKMYNETVGEKGAYIVAANSSWGRDGVWASNTPLWCAMYDKMGEEGVLNVAATTNRNEIIDSVGDMPSTCRSEYLLIVTSTDRNDIKATAGYSKVYVHLGAPGQNIYTTRNTGSGNDYEYFKGTSAASPMVAAVVGLLYAACCHELLLLGDHAPDSLTKLMRYLILKGTDPNQSLTDKTTSGGRLNAYKSLLELKKICDPLEPEDKEILNCYFDLHYNCLTDSLHLYNMTQIVDGIIREYQWDFGDGNTSKLSDPVHRYEAAGDYIVKLVAQSLSGKIDSFQKEVDIRKFKSIYPLPVDDILSIEVCRDDLYQLSLSDLNGRVVMQKEMNTSNGQLQISTQTLRPGIYILDVRNDKLFIRTKLLKLR